MSTHFATAGSKAHTLSRQGKKIQWDRIENNVAIRIAEIEKPRLDRILCRAHDKSCL
jgi:hypothetical protein